MTLEEKLTEFGIKYGHGLSRIDIDRYIEAFKKHLEYKTALLVLDENDEILACVRWNISPDGKTADILGLIMRPDFGAKKGAIKALVRTAAKTFPEVKYITWGRRLKYLNREPKVYKIEQFLRR